MDDRGVLIGGLGDLEVCLGQCPKDCASTCWHFSRVHERKIPEGALPTYMVIYAVIVQLLDSRLMQFVLERQMNRENMHIECPVMMESG